MARRTLDVEGVTWLVQPAGRTTQSSRDEFAVKFTQGSGAGAEHRIARLSLRLTKDRERALALLSDTDLRDLLTHSQPAWTSPEMGYLR